MFSSNFYHRSSLLLLFAVLLASGSNASAEPLRVGFLCPKPPDQGFWGQVIEVMEAAAEDLDIDLQVKCDKTISSFSRKRLGEQLLNSSPKLDYFLTGYWSSVTKHHLALAKERDIKVFVFNADINDIEKDQIGKPRGKYSNWIGHMVPDDKAAAMELVEILISRAGNSRDVNAAEGVNVYGFVGEGSSTITRKRKEGFREQVKQEPLAKFHEIVITTAEDQTTSTMKFKTSKNQAFKLMQGLSGANVICAGSQAEMWGAILGVEEAGKVAGKDIFIGGFDWNPGSLKAVADGRITATMFGHYIEGAWALLLVNDYHYGIDFADDVGVKIQTPMGALTPQNYNRYKALFGDDFWKSIDFKRYSKKYNTALKSYNFDIGQFLE